MTGPADVQGRFPLPSEFMQTLTFQHKIGDIVTLNYNAAGVFRKHGIDFCCGGGISLAEACRRNDLEPEVLLEELQTAVKPQAAGEQDFGSWRMSLLISWITETHHRYVREKTAEILAWTAKVANRHGQTLAANIRIHQLFEQLVPELLEHLASEEQRVFPLILQLQKCLDEGEAPPQGLKYALIKEFEAMEDEHEHAGDIMKEISRLTGGYNLDAAACSTWRVLWQNLEAFEQDLHKHVHLENNILFEKARRLLV